MCNLGWKTACKMIIFTERYPARKNMDPLSIWGSPLDVEKKKLDLEKKKLLPPFISITINVSHCENRQSSSHSWKSHFFLLSALSARQRFLVKRNSWQQKNRKLHRDLLRGRQRPATVNWAPSLVAFIWISQNRHWILGNLDCKILVESFCFHKTTIEHRRWLFSSSSGIDRINIEVLSAWLACKSLDFDKLTILQRFWLLQSGTLLRTEI